MEKENSQRMTSQISKRIEIMKRLREEEAQKARNLLASAMSHLEARAIVKSKIMDQISKINGNGRTSK
jgi:hypothetical protein